MQTVALQTPGNRGTLEMLHMREHFPETLSHDEERVIARKIGSLERFYRLESFMEHLQIPLCKAVGCSKRNVPKKIGMIFSQNGTRPEITDIHSVLTAPKPTTVSLGTLCVFYERIIAHHPDSHIEKICLRRIREHFRKK